MSRLCLVLAFIVASCTLSFADEFDQTRTGEQKGLRGVVNLSTALLELPMQTAKGYKNGVAGMEGAGIANNFFGGILGLGRGVVHSTGRVLQGSSEIAGFWAADNSTNQYHGTNYDSLFAYETKTAATPMEFEPAVLNITNKAYRGAHNIISSPYEFLHHTGVQARQNKPLSGLSKGIWVAGSRIWTGACELVSAPFPNSLDTVGNTFEKDFDTRVSPQEAQ